MRNLNCILLLTGVLMVTAAIRPSAAAAETTVNLRVTGITVIGARDGRAWAATLSLLGCSWRNLGPSPLNDDYVVRGTDQGESIRVLESATIWCNRVLQPINQNGRSLKLYGGEGDDTLYGGGSAPFSGNPNWVFGEAGDDTLYLGPGGAHGEGGPGNDMIYGSDNPGDVLLGGEGDDVLCEHADKAPLTIDGGEGDDRSCSPSATNGYDSVEDVVCWPCGLGY
jgi:RTX calcium-binding nonapeptide repeat (4 copies)